MSRATHVSVLLLLGLVAAHADEKPPVLRGSATTAERKIVLVELFTSQG